MSKRIVIVSGGKLEEKVCLPLLEGQEEGYVIGVDKGVEFLYNHQIMPDYIVGDFDSVKQEIVDYYRNETHVGIREFNPVKDASDTEIAIRLAMTLGGTDLVILGATGGRIDHLWANVQCLQIAANVLFSALIDVSMGILSFLQPELLPGVLGSNKAKSLSVIILDKNFRIVGESDLDDVFFAGFRYTCFVSKEGLNLQLLTSDDELAFATYTVTEKPNNH